MKLMISVYYSHRRALQPVALTFAALVRKMRYNTVFFNYLINYEPKYIQNKRLGIMEGIIVAVNI